MVKKAIKALIIENQITQYKTLSSVLTSLGISILPEDDCERESFIDAVRVTINDDYIYVDDGKYKEACMQYVYNTIIQCEPDIILVDYILGGSSQCDKGDVLMNNFFDKNKNFHRPVLFLSRLDNQPTEIVQNLAQYGIKVKWIPKSYSVNYPISKSDNDYAKRKSLSVDYIKNIIYNEIKKMVILEPEVVTKLNTYISGQLFIPEGLEEKAIKDYIRMRMETDEKQYCDLDMTIICDIESGHLKTKTINKMIEKYNNFRQNNNSR